MIKSLNAQEYVYMAAPIWQIKAKYKQMKNIFILLVFSIVLVVGCEEKKYQPLSDDGVAPAAITNVQFEPIAGGFDISYDIPDDSDLLYVKAVYTDSHGDVAEVKSSMYTNEITIEGFGDTLAKTVDLYSVDRGENISKPASFTANPLLPSVKTMEKLLNITADFGGAKFSWENSEKTPIVIMLYAEDTLGRMENVHNVYTSMESGSYSIRGMESVPTRFAAIIRDRWDNFSDSIHPANKEKLIPLLEERLDKTLFRKVVLANDDNWDAWEGDYYHTFDDDMLTINHTQGDHASPNIMTVDFGAEVTLSRFIVYQRQSHGPEYHAYTHGNPKKYDVYGSLDLPGMDGNLEDWTFLKSCTSIKPSGLGLGQNTDEDIDHIITGDEYTFSEPIKIRYFRFAVTETWDGAGYIGFSEMTFFGQVAKVID